MIHEMVRRAAFGVLKKILSEEAAAEAAEAIATDTATTLTQAIAVALPDAVRKLLLEEKPKSRRRRESNGADPEAHPAPPVGDDAPAG